MKIEPVGVAFLFIVIFLAWIAIANPHLGVPQTQPNLNWEQFLGDCTTLKGTGVKLWENFACIKDGKIIMTEQRDYY